MIDVRAGILAVTICLVIALIDNAPRPVKPVQVDYCSQPVWDKWGREIGAMYVVCSELDRYEEA